MEWQQRSGCMRAKTDRRQVRRGALVLVLLTAFGCSAGKPAAPREAAPQLVPVDVAKCRALVHDDETLSSLQEAALRSSAFFSEVGEGTVSAFGKQLSRVSLANLSAVASGASSTEELADSVCTRFQLYRLEQAQPLRFSAYTEAAFEARRERSERFSIPIYQVPDDLVEVDLAQFCPSCEAKLVQARVANSRVVPYYSRAEIAAGALAGNGYELGWLADPIDEFLLQLRGSGTVEFEDGSRMYLGYASSNGRPSANIGQLLVQQNKLAANDARLPGVATYLRSHPLEAPALMQREERHVFFTVKPVGPVGSNGVPITAGRTLAADSRYYPRGMLVFMRLNDPSAPAGAAPAVTRFAFVQDSAPGLQGPDELGLYVGSGGQTASRSAVPGELYLVLPLSAQ